jgi:FKBP-type peptidyl-prolyl cis-trans isomerase SlyD
VSILATVQIKRGERVRLDYELKVAGKGGEVIESSKKSGPIAYVHGAGKMLPGLEKRLEGMSPGDEKRGVIPAAEAFGTEESLPTRDLPRREFPKDEKLETGRVFQAKDATGKPVSFRVLAADDEKVKVRFLHPLAGKDIEFWVKILLIDDPATRTRAGVAPPPVPADALGEEEK